MDRIVAELNGKRIENVGWIRFGIEFRETTDETSITFTIYTIITTSICISLFNSTDNEIEELNNGAMMFFKYTSL